METLPTIYEEPRPAMTRAGNDSQVITMWLHGKSETTIRTYEQRIGEFLQHVGRRLVEITLEDLHHYSDAIAEQAPATRAGKLAAVKSLLTFAHDIGFCRFNVGKALRLPKVQDQLAERILSESEVQRMISLEEDPRNAAMLRAMYYLGLRVSELCGLCWKHVHERDEGAQVTVHGKGGRTRHILMPQSIYDELRGLSNDPEPDAPVFESRVGGSLSAVQVYRIVRDAAERAGIKKNVSPHWMRHAHASHALDRGAPVHLVKDTLGHASLATTSRYAHARPGDSSALYLAE